MLLHCSTIRVLVGMRFSSVAGRRFAFPSLPEGASLFLHCRKALRFSGLRFQVTFIRYTHLDYCVANASYLSPYLANLIGLANRAL